MMPFSLFGTHQSAAPWARRGEPLFVGLKREKDLSMCLPGFPANPDSHPSNVDQDCDDRFERSQTPGFTWGGRIEPKVDVVHGAAAVRRSGCMPIRTASRTADPLSSAMTEENRLSLSIKCFKAADRNRLRRFAGGETRASSSTTMKPRLCRKCACARDQVPRAPPQSSGWNTSRAFGA